MRTHRYTLSAEKFAGGEICHTLHDNVQDPYQLVDMADEKPDVVQDLMDTELRPWLERTGDPWLDG